MSRSARPLTQRGESHDRGPRARFNELVDARLLDLDPSVIATLEAGSVARITFAAQAVAEPIERVEDVCEGLVRSRRLLLQLEALAG